MTYGELGVRVFQQTSVEECLTETGFIDFDGSEFLKAPINGKIFDDKIIEKYAPNVVEGVEKLSNWAKNL